jgi:DNA uptake protein ComE-like DNA-binding protein
MMNGRTILRRPGALLVARNARLVRFLVKGGTAMTDDASTPCSVLRPQSSVAPGPFRPVVAPSPTELGSIGWALAPLVTVGMAAGPCFAYAAVRRRSRAFALAALVYGIASAAIVWGNVWRPGSTLDMNIGVVAVLMLWTLSTVHALAVRQRVFFGPVLDDAVVAAKERIRRRDESRRIAATDPRLARELRIGRPDQPSDYDDGGLVDVNHVPGEYLRATGGLDAALVSRIVEARQQVGRFDSLHDLELVAGLDPRSLDEVADRLIFCR